MIYKELKLLEEAFQNCWITREQAERPYANEHS